MTDSGLLPVAKKRLADLGFTNSEAILEPIAALVGEESQASDQSILADDAGALGRFRWTLLTAEKKKSSGVYYTPTQVASDLATSAVRVAMPATVCDPAMGGGVFLLAVADAMIEQGSTALDAFNALHGVDLDPVSVEVTRFCLGEWAWRHGLGWLDPGDRLGVADSLLIEPWPVGPDVGFDLVIGNPPFAGQLLSATVHQDLRATELKARYGLAAQAYTDAATLFLVLSAELSRDQVLLVLPRSLLGARDASEARSIVAENLHLSELWLGSGKDFNANVQLCALRLERRSPKSVVKIHSDFGHESSSCRSAPWAKVAALASGAPELVISSTKQLGDIAHITADFRDEYYALGDAVREAEGEISADTAKLVTSGLVDPAHLRWGETACKFAKRSWKHPVVQRDQLTVDKQQWFDVRRGPKILVASQTSVIEAVVDAGGEVIPATPVVTVTADKLWHVAALLCSPVSTLALLYATFGTAQGANALRVSAATLKALPLPNESAQWDLGAELIEQAHNESGQQRRDLLLATGQAITRAFGVEDEETLQAWWASRLPLVR